MASLSHYPIHATPAGEGRERRLAGLGVTLLLHAALIVLWQAVQPPPPAQEGGDAAIQWIRLPAPLPVAVPQPMPAPTPTPTPMQMPRTERAVPKAPAQPRSAGQAGGTAPAGTAPAPSSAASMPDAVTQDAAPAPASPSSSAASMLENARRSVGGIDRALRKERLPTIVAPPDSPQLRMQDRMEEAHALAPPRLWEAPKVQELVNNTGDGARRTRVVTGRRTYCVTERSPVTNVEMIEMHGKIRLTNCPDHEEPAKAQKWRTARD